jgi:hypothetical protein
VSSSVLISSFFNLSILLHSFTFRNYFISAVQTLFQSFIIAHAYREDV